MGFIKKVYSILAVQMAYTAGFIALAMSTPSMAEWMVGDGWWMWIPLFFVSISCEIAILCCVSVRRKVPINYILLAIFTMCFAYYAAQASVVYGYDSPEIVYEAAILTFGITGAVTLYAFTTKTDFTVMRGMMFVFSMSLTMFFILSLCFGVWMPTFWACLCVCLYGLFLLCDTQMIVGKHKVKLSIDDYIAGAMLIYIDIIMIFIYLL